MVSTVECGVVGSWRERGLIRVEAVEAAKRSVRLGMAATFSRALHPRTAAPRPSRQGKRGTREVEFSRNPNPNPKPKGKFLD